MRLLWYLLRRNIWETGHFRKCLNACYLEEHLKRCYLWYSLPKDTHLHRKQTQCVCFIRQCVTSVNVSDRMRLLPWKQICLWFINAINDRGEFTAVLIKHTHTHTHRMDLCQQKHKTECQRHTFCVGWRSVLSVWYVCVIH